MVVDVHRGTHLRSVKEAASQAVTSDAASLIRLSELLHGHPETGWEEHNAARWVSAALDEVGFAVTPNYLGLDTAFLATYGTGPFRLGLCAEYDALPGLGHACGHNLIASITVGAARALAPLADAAGLTIEVYGTPAEEGGGGKIELLERGAFVDLDLAMMAHPAPVDVAEAEPFAVSHSHVTYRGKAAHAAAYPEMGINAADAFTIAQVAVGLLRQQLPPTVRVHGVMTNGGEAPNAIPATTEGRWYVRAESLQQLAEANQVTEVVSLVDLLPTLVEMADGDITEEGLAGTSLTGLLGGSDGMPDRYVACEALMEGRQAPELMLRRGDMKYIVTPGDPELLFDLSSDPFELTNLAGNPDRAEQLAQFRKAVHDTWDIESLDRHVRISQARRRLVAAALDIGNGPTWDHEPPPIGEGRYITTGVGYIAHERKMHVDAPGHSR